MTYPSIHEVDFATRLEICRWYRFLSSPSSKHEIEIMDRIFERYVELGGITKEISDAIGWEGFYDNCYRPDL